MVWIPRPTSTGGLVLVFILEFVGFKSPRVIPDLSTLQGPSNPDKGFVRAGKRANLVAAAVVKTLRQCAEK